MPNKNESNRQTQDLFASARWYDLGINWEARLKREVPVLCDVFGPPGGHGLLDAACGPGRQLGAMAEAGYHMTGLDASADMLTVSRANLAERGVEATLIASPFDGIPSDTGPFDGIYCIGNSLAATGSLQAAERSLGALASALVPGGKLFVQILNFEKLRNEQPRVRGPRVRRVGETEYISARVFAFQGDAVEVTNVTFWNERGWRQYARSASLYAISRQQMTDWCEANALAVDVTYGNYNRDPFDPAASDDLIVVATRKEA